MMLITRCLGLMLLCTAVGGCSQSLYSQWGNQLNDLTRHQRRPEDVSMLLGTPPSRCESLNNPAPVIGALIDENQVVTSVAPNGAAQAGGLRAGDRITRVNEQAISNRAQLSSVIRSSARVGEPMLLETSRGVVSVVPRIPKAEQCYWDVQAGAVAKSGGAAFVNQYGGSAGASSSAYQRFFRASCRINDGLLASCQSNWQE